MRYKYNHKKQITKQNINKYQNDKNPILQGFTLFITCLLFGYFGRLLSNTELTENIS